LLVLFLGAGISRVPELITGAESGRNGFLPRVDAVVAASTRVQCVCCDPPNLDDPWSLIRGSLHALVLPRLFQRDSAWRAQVPANSTQIGAVRHP
jgi:hypothetical protein